MDAALTAIDPLLARRRYLAGIAIVALSTVAWASAPLFIRLLPYDMWTILFWRGVFGSLFVGIYLFWRFGRRTFAVIRDIGWRGVLITLFSAASFMIMVPAVQQTSVANAMIIYAALPVFTALVAWLWLRERPSMATMLASASVLVGISIMLGPTAGGPRSGDFLAAVGTLAMAAMTVGIRRFGKREMLPVAWLSTVLSAVIALPLAEHLTTLTLRDYALTAAYGLGPGTLGLMLFVIGSAMIPATLSALLSTMEAPLSAAWAWIGVGETPAPTTFLGGGIVLGAVIGRLLIERQSAGDEDRVST